MDEMITLTVKQGMVTIGRISRGDCAFVAEGIIHATEEERTFWIGEYNTLNEALTEILEWNTKTLEWSGERRELP